jgi:hypothetical protein
MPTKTLMSRDGAVRLARQAHNLKVVGSNPTPATTFLFLKYYSLSQSRDY